MGERISRKVDDSNHPKKGHSENLSETIRCVNVYLAKFTTLPETNMTPENRPNPKQGNSSSNQFSGATVDGKNPANQLISCFPIIHRDFCIQGGAGFLPSTVC